MTQDEALRQHLVDSLAGGHSHDPFEKAVFGWRPEDCGTRPRRVNHSAWELVEHLRIAQWDILEFSRNPGHVSPEWPSGYWPESTVPADPAAWTASIDRFRRDLEAMQSLVSDRASDLYARIPHGDGQTLLREALTLATHNSYHIGQLMLLRRMLGI